MTVPKFYRIACFSPFVVGGVLCAANFCLRRIELPASLISAAGLVSLGCVATLYAAAPYTIYLLLCWFFWRPVTAVQHRRACLMAPIVIAVPYGLLWQFADGFGAQGLERFSSFYIYAGAAVVTGYVYVALIELARMFFEWRGVISPAR